MLHRNRLFPVLASALLFILGGRQAKAMSLPASSQDSITRYEVLIDSSFMAGNLGDYPAGSPPRSKGTAAGNAPE